MINSIIKRHSRLRPFNETEITIIRSAAKLFLEKGYTHTTFKMLEADSGVKVGVITYHFHTKEDLLQVLFEELMEYHTDIIERMNEQMKNNLLSYAMEIAAQIALCECDANAWDLYYSAYNLPMIYDYIKAWAAGKNYLLLKDRLPHWTEHDFRDKEIVASGIELAALKTPCDRGLSLDKKIEVTLDVLMMIYEVSANERKEIIGKILELDYIRIAKDMFNSFLKRLDSDRKDGD